MRRQGIRASLALVIAVVALAGLTSGAEGRSRASAVLRAPDGVRMGSVSMRVTRGKLLVTASIGGLTGNLAGFHGFHIHSKGVCDGNAVDANGARSPFFTAGGHLAVDGQRHSFHDGDMPSLLVNRDGSATLSFRTDRATLAKLFDADGSAIIVHTGPDNFGNIPTRYTAAGASAGGPDDATYNTGDSGGRMICGVVK